MCKGDLNINQFNKAFGSSVFVELGASVKALG